MKYKLIKLSNTESRGNVEVGNSGRFYFDGVCFEFGSIRSSRVRQITISDEEMVVTTKNSTYFFEIDNTENEVSI